MCIAIKYTHFKHVTGKCVFHIIYTYQSYLHSSNNHHKSVQLKIIKNILLTYLHVVNIPSSTFLSVLHQNTATFFGAISIKSFLSSHPGVHDFQSILKTAKKDICENLNLIFDHLGHFWCPHFTARIQPERFSRLK